MMLKSRSLAWCAVLLVAATIAAGQTNAADNQNPKEREAKLIAVLQSDAPPAEKAITCKRLSVYGTSEAVPALAPLLLDKELSSWARIALEVIPGPAADEALRSAMGKAQGRLLVGVINSIAVRHDAQAVNGLVEKLKDKDSDPEVASAAAVALGRIGGQQAAQTLERSLAEVPATIRPAVAEGCILCAERSLAQGKAADAVKLYDTIRRANLPKQKLLEATRGAILARGSDGIPLLVEQLESADKAQVGIGLRTARELPGRDVTEALATELNRLSLDRRPLLLLALADRSDEAVLPVVVMAARGGPKEVRLVALEVLMRLGNVSCVPVLLAAAAENDAQVSQAAMLTLAHLPGAGVDTDLLARLPQATGKTRQVLLQLTGERQMEGALGTIMSSLNEGDAGVRSAAVQALGALGGDKQAVDLVNLLQKTQNPNDRANVEKALAAISGRAGASCVPCLLPLMQNSDPALRTIGLRVLVIAGGPDALAAVKSAFQDKDEAVQDEAARRLSAWPTNWPGDTAAAQALLALAKSDKKMLHQVLGLRGYLEYVRGDKQLNNSAKVTKVNELLPLIQRPEEKRLAISVVGALRTAGALELLTTLASDPAVTEDACSAIVNMSGRGMQGATRDQRQKALQMVVEKSKNDATKKRAEDLLQGVR
ncbi:MAG: HEAT repeat domain-containing protein [Planctomycetes bacterium]|nr:HEAT repeat domain-containing protein [Planctomycetota bacterium]